jgi:hypothetical protein
MDQRTQGDIQRIYSDDFRAFGYSVSITGVRRLVAEEEESESAMVAAVRRLISIVPM